MTVSQDVAVFGVAEQKILAPVATGPSQQRDPTHAPESLTGSEVEY